MTNIKKIRAEIERLKNELNYEPFTDEILGKRNALNSILSFINSLPEEPVSEELEKAAEEYAYINWESDDYHKGAAEGLPFDAIGHTEKCFKAGAQWDRERAGNKAIAWLNGFLEDSPLIEYQVSSDDKNKVIKDFRKALEED